MYTLYKVILPYCVQLCLKNINFRQQNSPTLKFAHWQQGERVKNKTGARISLYTVVGIGSKKGEKSMVEFLSPVKQINLYFADCVCHFHLLSFSVCTPYITLHIKLSFEQCELFKINMYSHIFLPNFIYTCILVRKDTIKDYLVSGGTFLDIFSSSNWHFCVSSFERLFLFQGIALFQ